MALHELPLDPAGTARPLLARPEPVLDDRAGATRCVSPFRTTPGMSEREVRRAPGAPRSTRATRSPGRSRCAARAPGRRSPYGSTRSGPAVGITHGGEDHAVVWELANGVGRALGREVDLAPFLGVMGMPPPEPGVHSTTPPRRFGGNIDCKELVAGTTLYLPIPRLTAPSSPPATVTRLRATARSRARRSRHPWTRLLTFDVRDDLPARVANRPDRRRLAHVRLRSSSRASGQDRR